MLTLLVTFQGTNGIEPQGSLVLASDGNFYGTTQTGGANGKGTLFQMTPAGVLTTILSFGGSDGNFPSADVTLGGDGNLYGTTYTEGSFGGGNIWKFSLPPPSRPIFTGFAFDVNNHFSMQLMATSGYPVSIQSSTNLSNWSAIATNLSGSNNLYQFIDTNNSGIPRRFYRATSP